MQVNKINFYLLLCVKEKVVMWKFENILELFKTMPVRYDKVSKFFKFIE